MAEGLQVTVPDKKKVALLFQPTVLRCHFSTSSQQPAVVQWKFKSYCQDRMGESLGVSSPRAQSLSKRNLEWDPYLDCLDSRRTVRVVASKQGSAVTLGDFYRGREITIVHGNNASVLNGGHGGRLVLSSRHKGMSASHPFRPSGLSSYGRWEHQKNLANCLNGMVSGGRVEGAECREDPEVSFGNSLSRD